MRMHASLPDEITGGMNEGVRKIPRRHGDAGASEFKGSSADGASGFQGGCIPGKQRCIEKFPDTTDRKGEIGDPPLDREGGMPQVGTLSVMEKEILPEQLRGFVGEGLSQGS
jgi:hypothetical protein